MRFDYLRTKHLVFVFSVLGLISFLQISNVQKVEASHARAGTIHVRALDSLKFEVVFKLYRDCRGIELDGYDCYVLGNGDTVKLTPTKTSIQDVSPFCGQISKPCNPANTPVKTNGVEEHILKDTLDFINDTALHKVLANCEVTISVSECCRNGAINTGVSGNFYVETILDLCKAPQNSTPELQSELVSIICCNIPYYWAMDAKDVDGDSISYAFHCPLGAANNCLSYSSPYSKDNPVTGYYPPNLPPNRRRPNSRQTPPWGVNLNSLTGELIFMPTKCNEVSVIAIQVTEWRLDTASNKMEIISETLRDMQVDVNQCTDNNTPTINGNKDTTYVRLCEGEKYCFNISTSDDPILISDTPKVYKHDSVTLSYSTNVPGGIFELISDTARLAEAKFCWQTKVGDFKTTPYHLVLKAKDNACPIPATNYRVYQFLVVPKPMFDSKLERLECNKFLYEIDISNSRFVGVPDREYQIFDITGKPVSDTVAYFYRNKKPWGSSSTISKNYTDTLYTNQDQPLVVRSKMVNLPFSCEVIKFDTIYPGHTYQLETDKLDSVYCFGSEVELKTQVTNSTKQFNYDWKIKGNWHLDSTQTILLTIEKDFDSVFVNVSDSLGCAIGDTLIVYGKTNPQVSLGVDQRICFEDSFKIAPVINVPNWKDHRWDPPVSYTNQKIEDFQWKFNSVVVPAGSDSVWVSEPGNYSLIVIDSMGCVVSDTFTLYQNDSFGIDLGPDQSVCEGDQVVLKVNGIDSKINASYRWYKNGVYYGNQSSYNLSMEDSTSWVVEVNVDQNGQVCTQWDTLFVGVKPLPVLAVQQSIDVCCDQPGIALDQYLPSNPYINSWSLSDTGLIVNDTFYAAKGCDPLQTKLYTVQVQFTDTATQCSATDSGVIRINPLPTVQIDRVYYTVSNDSIEDFEICTGKGDVQLEGDPIGGEWSVNPNKPGLLLDDVFQTQEADTGVLYTLVYAFEDTFGCRSTDTTYLKVACDSALSVWSPGQDPNNALKVYIPNAFTPNNTGPEANNTFTPQIHGASEYHIQIFNRMGVIVYEGKTMEKGWDGTYKGKPAAAGVYAYQITVKDVRGRDQVINGVVTVIR